MSRETIKYADALRSALADEMEADESVIVLGEEVAALGGVFTVTQGLEERFGQGRVLDSPICENGLVGWAIGAATEGLRPVVELMFSDFSLLALDQIANLGAKVRFMSNGQFSVPLVIRMPSGAGTNHGPQHSQSLESIFAHIPGLVVAVPSTVNDAYWMLRRAIRLDDPVIFLESKQLYFQEMGEVDDSDGGALGARVVRRGTGLTVATAGRMRPRCAEALDALEAEGVSGELVDMRYIWPLDTEVVGDSLRRTGRLAVVHEAVEFCGWGAELVAWAARNHFEHLDAPIVRVGAARTPVPFQLRLEDEVIPTVNDLVDEFRNLAAY